MTRSREKIELAELKKGKTAMVAEKSKDSETKQAAAQRPSHKD